MMESGLSKKKSAQLAYLARINDNFLMCVCALGHLSLSWSSILYVPKTHTVKPVLSGHPKIDKTKILMRNGSLMKVQSVAEHSAILLTCILSDNWS